jgi:hypothetical protein
MFQYLLSFLGSAYVQIVIFLVLLIYFFARRKDAQLEVSGIRYVRTLILVAVFFYLMFIWASSVQPTLGHQSLRHVLPTSTCPSSVPGLPSRPLSAGLAALARTDKNS